jgi:dienelactone hydrolase
MGILSSLLAWWTFGRGVPGGADARARQAVHDLARGHFADLRARMQPAIATAFDEATLRALWRQIGDAAGRFVAVEQVSASAQGGLEVAKVTCRFARAHARLVLSFDGEGRLAGLFFVGLDALGEWKPPAYAAAPGRYREEALTVGPYALPALLTRPAGAGPFAAVVLVHGSGNGDEDESFGAIKPFKDLALGLAARGVASLRYVKRARFAPAVPIRTVDDETVDDARAAVTLTAGAAQIDRARVLVLGHSLGGMLAPRIADGPTSVCGLIVLAGGGRSFDQILRQQLADDAASVSALDALLGVLPTLPDDAPVELLGALPAGYWRQLLAWRPAEAAAKLGLPMLVLQGDRDLQVRSADFEVWRAALAGRSDVVCKRYPTLTHLFTPGQGTRADYEQRDAHVDPEVIADIAAFVQRVRSP